MPTIKDWEIIDKNNEIFYNFIHKYILKLKIRFIKHQFYLHNEMLLLINNNKFKKKNICCKCIDYCSMQ